MRIKAKCNHSELQTLLLGKPLARAMQMKARFTHEELRDILVAETAKRLGKPLRPTDLIAFDDDDDELDAFDSLELEFELVEPEEIEP